MDNNNDFSSGAYESHPKKSINDFNCEGCARPKFYRTKKCIQCTILHMICQWFSCFAVNCSGLIDGNYFQRIWMCWYHWCVIDVIFATDDATDSRSRLMTYSFPKITLIHQLIHVHVEAEPFIQSHSFQLCIYDSAIRNMKKRNEDQITQKDQFNEGKNAWRAIFRRMPSFASHLFYVLLFYSICISPSTFL